MGINFNTLETGTLGVNRGSLYTQSRTGGILSSASLQSIYDYNETRTGLEYGTESRDIALADEVNTLIEYIINSEEDKAAEHFNNMIEYWTNPENSTTYANLNEKEMTAVIRTMIAEQTEDGATAEELIEKYTKDLKEVQNQQAIYGKKRCDSVTQGDLLKLICNKEVTEAKQNVFEKAWTGTKALGYGFLNSVCGFSSRVN